MAATWPVPAGGPMLANATDVYDAIQARIDALDSPYVTWTTGTGAERDTPNGGTAWRALKDYRAMIQALVPHFYDYSTNLPLQWATLANDLWGTKSWPTTGAPRGQLQTDLDLMKEVLEELTYIYRDATMLETAGKSGSGGVVGTFQDAWDAYRAAVGTTVLPSTYTAGLWERIVSTGPNVVVCQLHIDVGNVPSTVIWATLHLEGTGNITDPGGPFTLTVDGSTVRPDIWDLDQHWFDGEMGSFPYDYGDISGAVPYGSFSLEHMMLAPVRYLRVGHSLAYADTVPYDNVPPPQILNEMAVFTSAGVSFDFLFEPF